MVDHVGTVLLPGDIIPNLQESEATKKTVLGPGLRFEEDNVYATKPGILRFREPNIYWIDSHQWRYIPTKGDRVLGVVTAKMGDIFRVDIGSNEQATLSYLSFEGATKKNRPDVKVGDIIYGRLSVANKDMEPEMVCIDSQGRSNGLGVIRTGGFMTHVPLSLVSKVLSPDCNLFKCLGNVMAFDVAVGMNGRIWAKGQSMEQTIALINAILASEHMSNKEIKSMCKQMRQALIAMSAGT